MEIKYTENGIEKAMPIGKLKTNARGNIEFTRKELRTWADLLIHESIMKAMLCCTGYLMDEPEFDFTDEKKVDRFWEGVTKYLRTINDPNSGFSPRDLVKVINKYTGTKVFW